jgi:hypothetical protein
LCLTARDELWVCGASPQAWYRDGSSPPPKDALFMHVPVEPVTAFDTMPRMKNAPFLPSIFTLMLLLSDGTAAGERCTFTEEFAPLEAGVQPE